MNEIGLYIKKLRKEKGMTQSELADKLNVTFQAVSKWETGETLPDTSLLLDLCDELGTSVDTLLNGGVLVNKNRRFIKVENIVSGFNHLLAIKDCFGEESLFIIIGLVFLWCINKKQGYYLFTVGVFGLIINQFLKNQLD